MSFDLWIAFAVSAAVIIAMPGPTTLLIAGIALSAGTRAAAAAVLGVITGDIAAITLAFAGAGALLAAAPVLFEALRWVGAGYLLWLGLRLWRTSPRTGSARLETAAAPAATGSSLPTFVRGVLVTLLNPKGLMFFAAFMPQFLDRTQPMPPQMLILGTTHVGIALAVLAVYVRLAQRIGRILDRPGATGAAGRIGACLLIAAAILVASIPNA
jgi:homoserine/homoserine lactone efflux protein